VVYSTQGGSQGTRNDFTGVPRFTGLSPSLVGLSSPFYWVDCFQYDVFFWAIPGSLATITGISVDLFSSRYLDVSVP